jgi:hypothetical protein
MFGLLLFTIYIAIIASTIKKIFKEKKR